MSEKTVKRHYKKHKNKNKRTYRTYRKHKNKRTYRKKHFKIINNETGKGVQLFKEPMKIHFKSVFMNKNQIQSGNMIPGLRNM
jgi:hypothetical protein